jgi:hypothetical protein
MAGMIEMARMIEMAGMIGTAAKIEMAGMIRIPRGMCP